MIERALTGIWMLVMPALGPDSGLLAVAVFTAAAVLLAVVQLSGTAAQRPIAALVPALASATRANSRRTAYLLLRDPDAAGRPRPRAPGR
jgi:hypothetical protein